MEGAQAPAVPGVSHMAAKHSLEAELPRSHSLQVPQTVVINLEETEV